MVLGLDLANAYGSCLHELVKEALDPNYFPGRIRDLILHYYNSFHLRVTTGGKTFVDKSVLPGKVKGSIYQHSILFRILWPLLINKVPLTAMKIFNKRVSLYLHSWLCLPQSLSSTALYGNQTKLRISLSSLKEECMVARTKEVMQLKDCSDPRVSKPCIEVRTERKRRAQPAVEWTESHLPHKE